MNKNIQRTSDLLTKLAQAQEDALRFKPYPDSDPGAMKAHVDHLVEQGKDYRRFWIDATHGDYPQVPSTALEIKRGWNQWTRSVSSFTHLLAAPPEEQRRLIDYASTH